jgi:RNA polymerase sigma factor (sigma-70 family)
MPDTTAHLQGLLDQLQAGQDARDALLTRSLDRCRILARRMFRRNSDLRRIDETDDVLQKAMMRLHKALRQVKPANVQAFFGLAARHIRWVLCDLAEKAQAGVVQYGPDLPESQEPADPAGEPKDLQEWTDFHQAIERLPAEEREMFDLLFYQGLAQREASELLGVPLRTIKRRWQRAKVMLCDALRGDWPSLEGQK